MGDVQARASVNCGIQKERGSKHRRVVDVTHSLLLGGILFFFLQMQINDVFRRQIHIRTSLDRRGTPLSVEFSSADCNSGRSVFLISYSPKARPDTMFGVRGVCASRDWSTTLRIVFPQRPPL